MRRWKWWGLNFFSFYLIVAHQQQAGEAPTSQTSSIHSCSAAPATAVLQCLCFGPSVNAVRREPGGGGWERWSGWGAAGGQTKVALPLHWHSCVCSALPTTWRTCGWKTMLTSTWISIPSGTSWGLSTLCVSLWGLVYQSGLTHRPGVTIYGLSNYAISLGSHVFFPSLTGEVSINHVNLNSCHMLIHYISKLSEI